MCCQLLAAGRRGKGGCTAPLKWGTRGVGWAPLLNTTIDTHTHQPLLHLYCCCCRYVNKVDTNGYLQKLTNADTITSNAAATVPGSLGVNTSNVFRNSVFFSLYGTNLFSLKSTSIYQLC